MFIKSCCCLLALAGAALVAECKAAALAPVSPQQARPNYYPLKEGNKWDYRVEVDGEVTKNSMVVAKLEKIGGLDLFLLEARQDGNVVGTEHLASDKMGVFRHRHNGETLPQAICLIKSEAKVGDTWKVTMKEGDDDLTVKSKVAAEEEVQVPAGKFKALRIEVEIESDAGDSMTMTQWFAPNVGMVKQTISVGDMEITIELEKHQLVR